MGDDPAATAPAGAPLILSAVEAVARLEAALCGEPPTSSVASAEGLALTGHRAASIVNGLREGPLVSTATLAASCVHHLLGRPPGSGEGDVGFELVAATAQEAVDQSLAAHLLSGAIGRAGVCTISGSVAHDLAAVELPGADVLDEPADGEGDDPGVVGRARAALRLVSRATGRPGTLLQRVGPADAEVALLACADLADVAEAVRESLADGGRPVALITLRLARPLPVDDLREALAGATEVVVLGAASRPDFAAAAVEAAAADGRTVRVDSRPLAATPGPSLSSRLLATPPGPWADDVLRRTAALLVKAGSTLGPRVADEGPALSLAWSGSGDDAGADLLLASHPGALDPRTVSLVRSGGSILVRSDEPSDRALARRLGPDVGALVAERGLRAAWIPATPLDGGGGDAAAAEALAEAARRLLQGEPADGPAVLDPSLLAPEFLAREVDFRGDRLLPRMPSPPADADAAPRWARAVRRFHLLGVADELPDPAPGAPVRSAAMVALAAELGAGAGLPFAVHGDPAEPSTVAVTPLDELLRAACPAAADAGGGAGAVAVNTGRLAASLADALAAVGPGASLVDLWEPAVGGFLTGLKLDEAVQSEALETLGSMAGELPADAVLFDSSPDSALRLHLRVCRDARRPARSRLAASVGELAEGLRDLRLLHRSGSAEGRDPGAVSAAFGSWAGSLLDPGALAATTGRTQAPPLAEARSARIEALLAVIEGAIAEPAPAVVLVHRPGEAPPAPIPDDLECVEHPDPVAAAAGVFDGCARRLLPLFRAIRAARLELAERYDPALHDDSLARLGWEALAADELASLPAVVVRTTGARMRGRGGASLSELLRSSRPAHVLIHDEPSPADEATDLGRFHADLAWLVVAHREALVLQSSTARPASLLAGMRHLAGASRPAVALVTLPAGPRGPWSGLEVHAALHGRACPELRYDPSAGRSWADRLDLSGNPGPELPHPLRTIRWAGDDGEGSETIAFTWADTVASSTAHRAHFRIVPTEAWSDEQVALARWLEADDPAGDRRIPYILVHDEAGDLARAVVTRDLAMAARGRLRAWRVLQEMAGFDNEHARRAAARAREEAEARADERVEKLRAEHRVELTRVETAAARESLERLAAALLRTDSAGLPAVAAAPPRPAAAPSPAAPSPAAPSPAAPSPAAARVGAAGGEPAEESMGFDEAYIDSDLCTTCNECTNLNGRMFQYNADKQAFITDTNAGTFEELVKAAELCPAECIHPGAPRPDDATATPDMLARAAALE